MNGKFCFKIAASLCCGLGAKGAFLCEVGYEKLADFGAWLAYQLYGLDYHFFELIVEDAFKAYSKICVMLISDMKDKVVQLLDKIDTMVDTIRTTFKEFQEDMTDGVNASSKRNQLAKELNTIPERLLSFTPEAKGTYCICLHDMGSGIMLILTIEVMALFRIFIMTARKLLSIFCLLSRPDVNGQK